MGWTLPGFADDGWRRSADRRKTHAGTDWYRATFDLSVPKRCDLGPADRRPDTPRSPGRYRADLRQWLE
jgi:hypothetical protein